MDELTNLIIEHEGLKLFPYKDTVGKLTIGVGRNLTDRGIRHSESMIMLANDMAEAKQELSHFDWFNKLDPVRQGVMIELNFNIGLTSLMGFHQTLLYIKNGNLDKAASQLLQSKWATQVGVNRSHNMAERLRTGKY